MAGESSHFAGTGTAPWFYHVVVGWLFGLRGEARGLRIDPQLPKAWRRAGITRVFRGARFDVEIRRSRTAGKINVSLDGKALRDNLVPVQPAGTRHVVRVMMPV
jgi:cellobionic acid phosphorylase